MTDFNILLFDGFETLDAFGPAEIISKMPNQYQLKYYSMSGGIVTSSQNIQVTTLCIDELIYEYVFLIPGGIGTRTLVNDDPFIDKLASASEKATYVLTVCTGTALLAKTGLIDGIKATTNKMAYDWVIQQNERVDWIREARWVTDGNFYTSSGVSAGMDMTLGFISDLHGEEESVRIAKEIEYLWNKDKTQDPFCD